MEASNGALIKCCSQNQRQTGVSLGDISWERRVSRSRCVDLLAFSHLCTAPPSTLAEIFLFFHKNTLACFPFVENCVDQLLPSKEVKILGFDRKRRRWFIRIGIEVKLWRTVALQLAGNLFHQGFRCGTWTFGVFSHFFFFSFFLDWDSKRSPTV